MVEKDYVSVGELDGRLPKGCGGCRVLPTCGSAAVETQPSHRDLTLDHFYFGYSFSYLGAFVGLVWGFFFTPDDFRQGSTVKIIYLHVPAAWMSMFVYMVMAVAGGIGLVWRMKLAEVVAISCAPIGASFTFLALITGSIWGKPMWGTWWVWDARLTAEIDGFVQLLDQKVLRKCIDQNIPEIDETRAAPPVVRAPEPEADEPTRPPEEEAYSGVRIIPARDDDASPSSPIASAATPPRIGSQIRIESRLFILAPRAASPGTASGL